MNWISILMRKKPQQPPPDKKSEKVRVGENIAVVKTSSGGQKETLKSP